MMGIVEDHHLMPYIVHFVVQFINLPKCRPIYMTYKDKFACRGDNGNLISLNDPFIKFLHCADYSIRKHFLSLKNLILLE